MSVLYIGSTSGYSGKNMIVMGLGVVFSKAGRQPRLHEARGCHSCGGRWPSG